MIIIGIMIEIRHKYHHKQILLKSTIKYHMETKIQLFPNELLFTWFIQDRLKLISKSRVIHHFVSRLAWYFLCLELWRRSQLIRKPLWWLNREYPSSSKRIMFPYNCKIMGYLKQKLFCSVSNSKFWSDVPNGSFWLKIKKISVYLFSWHFPKLTILALIAAQSKPWATLGNRSLANKIICHVNFSTNHWLFFGTLSDWW